MKRPSVAQIWSALERVPGGKRVFSTMIGRMAPYTATVDARVEALSDGHSVVVMHDRRAVRNHLRCVHAIALMNLGEVSTGLAVLHCIDGRGRGIIKALKMDYLKKARGTITATCDVDVPSAPGDHDVTVVASLQNTGGEVVARATATWKISLG
jgi:acyl-coenzyme A thioesterase PaaI-like protein